MSRDTTNSAKEQNQSHQAHSENVFYDPFGTPGFHPAFIVPTPTSKSSSYFEGYSPTVANGNPLFANQPIFNPYLNPYGFYNPYLQNQQTSENSDNNAPQKMQENLHSSTQDVPHQKLDKSPQQSKHKSYYNNSGEYRRNNTSSYNNNYYHQQHNQHHHHEASPLHYSNSSPQNYSQHEQHYFQTNYDSHHHYNNNYNTSYLNRREHFYDTQHQSPQYYEHSRQNKSYQNSRKPKLLYEEISKEENVENLKEQLEQERKILEEQRRRFDEERKKYEEEVRKIELLEKQKEEQQILKLAEEHKKLVEEENAKKAKILASEKQKLEQKREEQILLQQEEQRRKELEDQKREEEKKANHKKKEYERKKREKKQPSTKDVKNDQAYAKQLQEELNREAELKMKEEYAKQQRVLIEQENQLSRKSKSSTIIVSEIPYEVSEEKIKTTLATYGKIVNVQIKTVYSTLSTSITAYATYDSEFSATKALKHFSGKKRIFPHQDRPLVSKYQLSEEEASSIENSHEESFTVKNVQEQPPSSSQIKKEEKHVPNATTSKKTNAMYSVLEDLEEIEPSLSEETAQKTVDEVDDTNDTVNKSDKSKNKKKYQKQLKKQIKKSKQESKHKHHEKHSKSEEEETLNAFIAKAEEEKQKKLENLEKLRSDPNNKFIPCKNYFSREGCPYGRSCPFSHDSVLKDQFKEQEKQKKLAQDIYRDLIEEEAKEESDFVDLEKEAEKVTEMKKSKLCLFYGSKEGCRFGERCQFCHLDDKSIHEEYHTYCAGKNKSRFCQCSPYNAEPQCFDPKNMKLTKLQQRLMEKQGSKVLIESLGLFEMKPSDLRKHLYILKNASKEQHQNGNYWLLFPDTGVSMMLSKLDHKEGQVVKQHFEEEEKKKTDENQKTGTIYDPEKDNETPVWNILGDAKHQTCILHFLETKLPLTFLPSSYEIEDHIYEKALWGTPDVKKDEDFPTILERINDNIIEDEESEESEEGDFMSARDAFMFMMMNSFFGRGDSHEGGNGKAYYCNNCGQWHYH